MSEISSDDIVLFVDDEENILNSIRRGLIDEPYKKLFANSPFIALEMLEEHSNIAAIVTDMRMPEMTGLELLKKVKQDYPDVIRLILTGYSQISTLMTAINEGHVYHFISKPWKLEAEFIPTIRNSIEFHHMILERKEIINKLKKRNMELNKVNFRINSVIKDFEKSESKMATLLRHLSKRVLPYVSEVISVTEGIVNSSKNKSIPDIGVSLRDIYQNGKRLYKDLNKVQNLIEANEMEEYIEVSDEQK